MERSFGEVISEFARAHYAFAFPITIFFVVSVHAIHRSQKKKVF